jgi:hypothetical protein
MVIACHSGAKNIGAEERALVDDLAELCERGHDVVLLCNSERVIEHALDRGVPARRCRIGRVFAIHHALVLARELYRLNPDVFVIATRKKLFLAKLGARIARVRRIVLYDDVESLSALVNHQA